MECESRVSGSLTRLSPFTESLELTSHLMAFVLVPQTTARRQERAFWLWESLVLLAIQATFTQQLGAADSARRQCLKVHSSRDEIGPRGRALEQRKTQRDTSVLDGLLNKGLT